jgi:hypothetical protein
VLGSDGNIIIAGLFAEAAGLGASSPGVPGMLAVNGAGVGVAVLHGRSLTTTDTAVLGSSDDRL